MPGHIAPSIAKCCYRSGEVMNRVENKGKPGKSVNSFSIEVRSIILIKRALFRFFAAYDRSKKDSYGSDICYGGYI